MTGDEIVALSKKHTISEWAAQNAVAPIPIARAKGVHMWTPEGKRYIDFNSQLMSVNIGHGDTRVNDAIATQLAAVAYVTPALEIISRPSSFANRSIPDPASRNQKMPSAITQLTTAPDVVSRPVNASRPSPQPAILPRLNTSPPKPIRQASARPSPGNTRLAMSCARISATVMMRQIFICAPISSNSDTRITKPIEVPRSAVKRAVCVRKPGPMAEVAIRNAAPSRTDLVFNIACLIGACLLLRSECFRDGPGKPGRILAIAMNADRFAHDRDLFSG